jgi:hypothetical protein
MLILTATRETAVAKGKGSDQALVVAGKSVRVTHDTVSIGSVRLDPDNPRIRFQLQQQYGKGSPTQEELRKLIKDQPAYGELQKAIRKAGGLHDPIIIRHDGSVVEGNTRVTVIATLHEGAPADPRWKLIPAVRLPKDVPPESIAMLMASYHIAGKNTWQAFVKADQIYHLKHTFGCSVEQIADETRTTKRDIEQQLEAYEYLIKEVMPKAGKGSDKNLLMNKWSHALEFVKNRELAPIREDPAVRKTLGKLLINNQIKGMEVRDLAKVLKNKQANKVLQKGGGFKEAKAVLRNADPTIESLELRQIKKLTSRLAGLKASEWAPFKTDTKAQKILSDHAKALHFLMKMIGMKEQKFDD